MLAVTFVLSDYGCFVASAFVRVRLSRGDCTSPPSTHTEASHQTEMFFNSIAGGLSIGPVRWQGRSTFIGAGDTDACFSEIAPMTFTTQMGCPM